MKTTIELPDDLYRAAKAEAALRGRPLKDLVEEGLRLALARAEKPPRERVRALLKRAAGIADSGIADLGSNSAHMDGFGRNRDGDR